MTSRNNSAKPENAVGLAHPLLRQFWSWAAVCAFLIYSPLSSARAEQVVFTPPEMFSVKDGPAQIALGIQDGALAHTSFTVSLQGRAEVKYATGYEFVIQLPGRDLTPFDFTMTKFAQAGPGSLDLDFKAADLPLTLIVHYRQDHGAFYLRKWIELRPDPGAELFVDAIVLWAFDAWATPQALAGPGQPVYVGDTFFGVAYPAADNTVYGDKVACSYLVGLTVTDRGYVSREGVYGVTAPGQVRKAFLAYIDQVRARPVSPFLLWNSWYDLRNFSDQQAIASIAGLKKDLCDPFGVKLDSIVLDDGWDDFNRLWQPDPARFPHGFEPVAAAARDAGVELGLWMSPVGGYVWNQRRRLWGAIGQGYEKNLTGFCFAGQNYRQAFTERMVEYTRDPGVNYFKLDNLNTTCPFTTHGHRSGKYATVGLTDAFIETLTTVRAARPDVMINFTVGSWLSPWWLMHADVLWRGGMDFGAAGDGGRRQQSITYVDTILYKRLREERAQFPISSLMTHGIIKGKYQSFGEEGENLRDFSDDVWMYFGRGVMMQELYLSPELLSAGEWEVLARGIHFARENAALLSQAEMVLGDPGAGEVYGFYHELDGRSLLVVRNPADSGRNWPAAAGDSGCAALYSSLLNPTLAPLGPLAPFEVRVLQCSGSK